MYYPYLRAKQFELLAVREFASLLENDDRKIFPIIEPVKKTFSSLNKAIKILVEKRFSFALIINPQVGEIVGETALIEDNVPEDIKGSDFFYSAYIVHAAASYSAIQSHIAEKGCRNVMLILSNVGDIDNQDFINLYSNDNIRVIVIEQENRTLKRRLLNSGKSVVLLKDNFNTQKRNSDYLSQCDELFTEEHSFYEDDGYSGFSDYTTIGKDFLEGGRLPYAVAIHLTYKKNQEQVWIRHFVSDTNDDNSNIQGKFGEAAEKAVRFLDEQNMHYQACEELRGYYNTETYPGLGMIKKISIKNHLELINDILT
ncbi:MAG: sce7725 family protein [Prevotellaceae bacterium]|jgi:hypothetical protein|nr:sce7725 family protein [Prevotellaceae bacterium]